MHQVFSVALDTRMIDADTYTRWSANLIEAGHSYLGVSSMSLGRALILDARDSRAPGRLFDILTNALGGKTAEAHSHIEISQQFLNELWSRQGASAYRHDATALLMSKLLRYRHDDYAQIVAMMLLCTRRNPQLFACIRHWAKLYFIPEEMIAACLRSYTLIDGPQS